MRDGGSPAASTEGPTEPFPIGHVHWTLPPTVGGVETYLAEVSKLTAARGFPVTVSRRTVARRVRTSQNPGRTRPYVDWDRESDSFKKEVELLIESLEMGPYVEFKSAAFNEMATLYAQADVVIISSR